MYLKGNIKGLQHLGIPVSSLEKSKEFYKSLGFIEIMSTEIENEGGRIKVAFMEISGLTIELYQFDGDKLLEIKARGDGHIDHVALDVEDIDAAYSTLKDAGFNIIDDAPKFLPFFEHGVQFFTITGPDGEKVEFNHKI